MSTVTTKRPRVKAVREASYSPPLGEGRPALLTIALGKDADHYHLHQLASDFGQAAFRLEKFGIDGGEVYDVLLDDAGHSCECLGFLRWDHCKHVETLLELTEAGKL